MKMVHRGGAILVLAVCLTLDFDGATSQTIIKNGKRFQFNVGTHFRTEYRGDDGAVEGEYGFRTPDGCMHVVKYAATKQKYNVLGTSKRDCIKAKRVLPTKKSNSLPQIIERMQEFTPIFPKSEPPFQLPPIEETPLTILPSQPPLPASTTKTTSTTTTEIPTPKKQVPVTKKPIKSIQNIGKQLLDSVAPPPDIKRPRILSPEDPDPVYSFGYQAPGHGHTQAGLPDGTKKGEFFFDSPDGWRRFVTYEARQDGFFPKLRRERIPGWEDHPLNPKNRLRNEEKRRGKQVDGGEGGVEGGEGNTGGGGTDGVDGKDGKNGEEPVDGAIGGKQLNPDPPLPPPSNGCPYYFYTNTKINFHWERCIENGTRVGEYGRLADDGFSHRVKYYADARGFHPRIIKTPLTREQEETVAGFTQGAFIIPKIEEQKQETEKRIQEWISRNQDRIDNPL